jgi:hypothetical protein
MNVKSQATQDRLYSKERKRGITSGFMKGIA